MTGVSRRDVLAVVAAAGAGGCGGRPDRTGDTTVESGDPAGTTESDAPTETTVATGTLTGGELCAAAFDGTAGFAGTQNCPDAEIGRVLTEPRGDGPTDDTPSSFEDYVIVEYELTDRARTLDGCVDAVGERVPFRREVTPTAGGGAIEIGPFGHHAVNGVAVRFVGCRDVRRWP